MYTIIQIQSNSPVLLCKARYTFLLVLVRYFSYLVRKMAVLFSFSLYIFVILFLSSVLEAGNNPTDNHGVQFLFPSQSLTLSLNDTVNVTYTSSFSVPLLYTFCYNGSGTNLHQGVLVFLVLADATTYLIFLSERVQNVPPFNGSQLVQLEWDLPVCNFDLRPNSSAGFGANSPTIEVLPTPRAQPTTIGLAQSTAIGGLISASNDASITTSPDSSSNLSSGATAGIGVGVALGAVAILVVGGCFLLRRRKARKVEKLKIVNSPYDATKGTADEGAMYNKVAQSTVIQPEVHEALEHQELPSGVTHELASSDTIRHEIDSEPSAEVNRRTFSWNR